MYEEEREYEAACAQVSELFKSGKKVTPELREKIDNLEKSIKWYEKKYHKFLYVSESFRSVMVVVDYGVKPILFFEDQDEKFELLCTKEKYLEICKAAYEIMVKNEDQEFKDDVQNRMKRLNKFWEDKNVYKKD